MLKDDLGDSSEGRKVKFGEIRLLFRARLHADRDDCLDDDPDLFDQLPPLPPFLSYDDDSFLGIEEGDPVVRFGDGDGPPEEGEANLTDSFGDEEEMGGRTRRPSRFRRVLSGERDGWKEGEFEDVFDDFEREGEGFGSHIRRE